MPEITNLPPLSLYIHIPWCIRKCPYCDFNSHAAKGNLPEQLYIDALLEDFEQHLPIIWGRRLISIFIGGGTPSLFSPEAINNLLSGIRARIQCIGNLEITMEANPGTFEQNKFNEFRNIGINRLSIGIQSFDNEKLDALGRIHNSSEAIRAVETAQFSGFENINLDLMFGLPNQSIQQGIDDLKTAIALKPSHISWYQLTIEPNTFFYSQPPVVADDDTICDLQQHGQTLLAEHDFNQYEISAYAKGKKQCQHNLNYWQFGDYLGIGAGAHGKITRSDEQSITRHWKLKQPQAYMDAKGSKKTSGSQLLQTQDRIFEFMLNALRLKQGFDLQTFESHTGLSMDEISSSCQQAIDKGLLKQSHQHIEATDLGYRFLNDLINQFD
jgi:putative oxygen-independent coproporphyrinogen III oxidase